MSVFTFTLDNPDEMQATMTYTMTVGEWKALQKTINTGGVIGSRFSADIKDIIRAAEKHFNEYDAEKIAHKGEPR